MYLATPVIFHQTRTPRSAVQVLRGSGPLEQFCHRGPGDREPAGQRVVVVEPVVVGSEVTVVVSHEALACQAAASSPGTRAAAPTAGTSA